MRPCPFCGGKIMLYFRFDSTLDWPSPDGTGRCRVMCENDCFSMPARHDAWFSSEQEARNAVNMEPK